MLLIDIDMPRDCPYCPMSHWNKLDEFTGCDAVSGKKFVPRDDLSFWKSGSRPDWCPIKADITQILRDAFEKTLEASRYDGNPTDLKVFKDDE
jgi:hypothetical protein